MTKDIFANLPEEVFMTQDEKDCIRIFGREAYEEGMKKLSRLNKKKDENYRNNLIRKWEETKNKSLLPAMEQLGIPVDYSPID